MDLNYCSVLIFASLKSPSKVCRQLNGGLNLIIRLPLNVSFTFLHKHEDLISIYTLGEEILWANYAETKEEHRKVIKGSH